MPRRVKTSVGLVVHAGGGSIKQYNLMGKYAFSVIWVSIPALPITYNVFLRKLINHSVPQFPHMQRENNNSTHHMKL